MYEQQQENINWSRLAGMVRGYGYPSGLCLQADGRQTKPKRARHIRG